MRSLKIKKSHILITAVNAVFLTAVVILGIVGNLLARSHKYNYTAELWKNGGSENFSQISCYFSESAGFSTDLIQQTRGTFTQELKNISVTSDTKLFPDSYSTDGGKVTVTGDLSGRSDAQLTVAGGDFFFFRNFNLLDGAYFSESDTMQDGAVIDTDLAWSLYGSYKVSGMNIFINGVKFYISGVIAAPSVQSEIDCSGSLPRIYIPYETSSLVTADKNSSSEKFTRITCYECVLPDPVENFAFSMVKKQFSETYSGNVSIVNNSKRFLPQKRAKAFMNLSDYAVRKDGIVFPYWENASRKTEFRLSFIYFFRNILLAPPLITLAVLVFRCVKKLKVLKKQVKDRIISVFEKKRWEISQKIKERSSKP